MQINYNTKIINFLSEPLAKNIATVLEAKHKLEVAIGEVAL